MRRQVVEGWAMTPEQTKLFYTASGDANHPVAVVFCNGIGVEWQSFWPGICRPLANEHFVINWDYRGHGRSEAPLYPEKLDIADCARDLARVLDAQQVDKAVVVGHSMGVQVAFEFFRLFPERTLGLIPILGTYKSPMDTFLNWKYSSSVFDLVSKASIKNQKITNKAWPFFFHSKVAQQFARKTGLIHNSLCPFDKFDLYLTHLRLMSPTLFMSLARKLQEHSAEDLLDDIDIPTLIFAGERDIMTPIEASREMHHRIRTSQLQIVKEGSHAALVEQPDLFWLRINFFLREHFQV